MPPPPLPKRRLVDIGDNSWACQCQMSYNECMGPPQVPYSDSNVCHLSYCDEGSKSPDMKQNSVNLSSSFEKPTIHA